MTDVRLEDNPKPFHEPVNDLNVPKNAFPIGIDIGGTKINAAVVLTDDTLDGDERIVSLQNAPTPETGAAFLQTLVDMVNTLRKEYPIACVGIATAGVVDSIHGRILGSTGNLPALSEVSNLQALLEERLQLPVHIENDANAAAYGEWRGGAARGATNMFAVTLGTGVGMGIVFNGQMYRGSHFFAAEGGHIAISTRHERKCTCGRWDCWEAFASGYGMEETARQLLTIIDEASRREFLSKYCSGEMTTYAVIEAWRGGNALGKAVMDAWHLHIAVGVGSLINVMDPDIVVVGGGLAQFVDFDKLQALISERAMGKDTKVVPARLENLAGIMGAAYLALESPKSS